MTYDNSQVDNEPIEILEVVNTLPNSLKEPNVITHHDFILKDESIDSSMHIYSYEFTTEISEWISNSYEIRMLYRYKLNGSNHGKTLFNLIYETYVNSFIKHIKILRQFNHEHNFLTKIEDDAFINIIEKIRTAFPKLGKVEFHLI